MEEDLVSVRFTTDGTVAGTIADIINSPRTMVPRGIMVNEKQKKYFFQRGR